MRLWLLLVLVALPHAAANCGAACDNAHARAFASLEPNDSPYLLEAIIASGVHPATWPANDAVLGRMAIVEEAGNPLKPIREIYAASHLGPVYDDSERGPVNLLAQLLRSQDDALASNNDAVHSFTILSLYALGAGDQAGPLVVRLAQFEQNGTWGCGTAASIECTSYALLALDEADALEPAVAARARAYLQSFEASSMDAHQLSWAIHAAGALGQDVPAAWWNGLLALQAPDGQFLFAGQPSQWATQEAVVALGAGHPLPFVQPLPAVGWQAWSVVSSLWLALLVGVKMRV